MAHILIVEDRARASRHIARWLSDDGHMVQVINIDKLESAKVAPTTELTILHFEKFIEDSLETFFADRKTPSTKTLVLARFLLEDDEKRAYEKGIDHFIVRNEIPRHHLLYITKRILDKNPK